MKICYLCGKERLKGQEIDKDHIIPKNLLKALSDKEKKELLTERVHRKCHEQYDKDDKIYGEYMRLLTGNIANNNINAEDIFTKNVFDSDKYPANHKITQETIDHEPIYETEEGIVHKVYYTDGRLTSEQSKSINNITWKIVRGLYYRENRKVLRKEVKHQIIPQVMPIIYYQGKTGIIQAIACYYYLDSYQDQLKQFYEAQADLKSIPNEPKTQHPKSFNYRYNDNTNRGDEIWELQYCEDIIQIVKYKKSQTD